MTTVRQVKAHDATVWFNDSRVDSEVGRSAGQWLDVDAPLFWAQVKQLQCPLLGESLHLIDELIATVVPGGNVTIIRFTFVHTRYNLRNKNICSKDLTLRGVEW